MTVRTVGLFYDTNDVDVFGSANSFWLGPGPSVYASYVGNSPALSDFWPTTAADTGPPVGEIATSPITSKKIYNIGQSFHRTGGGIQELVVRSSAAFTSQGAGESFSHRLLGSLVLTAIGQLVVNDRFYKNVFFTSGRCQINRSGRGSIVDISLTFVRSTPFFSEVTFEPVVGNPPAEFPGRTNNGDYTASNLSEGLIIDLGFHTDIASMSVSRRPLFNEIPRAYGVRLKNLYSKRGAIFRMTLATEIRADFNFGFGITAGNTSPQRASLETKIHQIVALSGRTAPLQLVGNGNVFDRVHITGVNVQELDSYQTAVGTIDALQEVVV